MVLLKQFDVVTVIRTDRAIWLSTPGNSFAGSWSVVHIFGDELVVFRAGMLLRIPLTDVQQLASYSLEGVLDAIRSVSGYGQSIKREIDR